MLTVSQKISYVESKLGHEKLREEMALRRVKDGKIVKRAIVVIDELYEELAIKEASAEVADNLVKSMGVKAALDAANANGLACSGRLPTGERFWRAVVRRLESKL